MLRRLRHARRPGSLRQVGVMTQLPRCQASAPLPQLPVPARPSRNVGTSTAKTAFLKAEARAMTRYNLSSRAHQLELADPQVTLRALEFGSGEPALLMHGISLSTALWAPLLARLTS